MIAEGVDVTKLSITPFEGFMLSRIDGRTSVQEVCDTTGATVEQVEALLHKLEAAAALAWRDDSGTVRQPSSQPKAPPKRESRPEPAKPNPRVLTRPPPPEGSRHELYDPTELEEEQVELELDRRREILDAFYQLKDLNHYELLGVPRDADKKQIRDAYFRLSKRFHPDTLFGRRLGTYKTKMERVFEQLTDAYETLGKKKNRIEYDAYLATVDETRHAAAILDGADPLVALEATPTEALIELEPLAEAEPSPAEPPSEEQPPASSPPSARTSPLPPRMSVEERRNVARQLLERRLGGQRRATGQSARPASPPPPVSEPPTERRPRADVLRGLASTLKRVSIQTGGPDRTERQLVMAREAERSGDLIGAANAYRLAMSMTPGREDVRAAYEDIRQRLAKAHAGTFEKQASYEEEKGQWDAAARSWARVAEGRPEDAKPRRRAAMALLEAAGDLKLARTHAQEAVRLEPRSGRNRAVLGRVFLKAGMLASARKEAEEAARLDPNSDFVKDLLRELK